MTELEREVYYFWRVAKAARVTACRGRRSAVAKAGAEELEAIAMHAGFPEVRRAARGALHGLAGRASEALLPTPGSVVRPSFGESLRLAR